MVKQSMDLLELLRKRGMDGDVDFLREALRVLVDGIMDAEVSAQIDARWQTLQPGWGKDHSSELRPLYEVLQDDEEIEALVSCTWGPGSVFREDAGRMDRMRRNKGVALVTRERVVMLKGHPLDHIWSLRCPWKP